jgi:hypothetical protein
MRKHRAVPVRSSATAAGLHLIIHGMRFEIIDFSRRLFTHTRRQGNASSYRVHHLEHGLGPKWWFPNEATNKVFI